MFNPATNKQKFIYTLIYPALLGSMLFEILPIKFCLTYLFKILIITFFLLDYYHLYFIMDSQFEQDKKNSNKYIFSDLFVSVFLFVALKYADIFPLISVWAIFLVTICFLIYSNELNYEFNFYKYLASIALFYTVIMTFFIVFGYLTDFQSQINCGFLILTLFLYSKHILKQAKIIHP
jgi:hypothetical protein